MVEERFMKVTSGTCASNLYHDISDVETCKRAVLLFERNKECAVVKGSRRRCVEGCTYEATRQTGLGGKISGIGRKTEIVYKTIGSCDTEKARIERECTKKNPCVCKVEDPEHPDPPPLEPFFDELSTRRSSDILP